MRIPPPAYLRAASEGPIYTGSQTANTLAATCQLTPLAQLHRGSTFTPDQLSRDKAPKMATKPEPTLDLASNNDRLAEASEPLRPQPLPSALLHKRSKENCGGYDCVLVQPPPSVLQTECPVCLLVLKEPCIVSCCGHKFCRECIEPIKKGEKPCALCNEPDFMFMRERALERSLKDLEVWCPYRKEGCEWKEKLGKLEEHLNRDSSQLNGCHFVAVECTHKCGKWFQSRHITTHELQQCKKRPYSCDYCRLYYSTFEDVTEVHYPQCGKYPVACPNSCDVCVLERQNVESHLKEHCPLVLLVCPFNYAGCKTQFPRRDMPVHMKENITHLTLLATTTQTLLKENQELQQKAIEREGDSHKNMAAIQVSLQELNMKCNSVVKENQKLQSENDELKKIVETFIEKYSSLITLHTTENEKTNTKLQELLNKQQITENKVGALNEGLQKQKLEVQQFVSQSGFPVDYYVKQTDEEVYLPAFYTHPQCHGYRMCVSVDPNGYGDGEGTHISIFTFMMQGPFDDYLKWPFRGQITIQIVNQVGDHGHVERIISYTDNTPDDTAGRVTDKERADFGWGEPLFLAHSELQYNAARQTQYLKDNTLHISIIKVKLH